MRLEEKRLRAVDELGLFGTGPEERFDRITALACELFDVPMSTITVMGSDCQWPKSAAGIELGPVDRDITFCDHTVRSGRPVIVEDATRDPRFAANPFVTGPPGIRFYAGMPLAAADGSTVGTLCLLDDEPRRLSAAEEAVLTELAGWVQAEFSHSVELDRAAEIQHGLLPGRAGLEVAGHQLAAMCVPSRTVGGDLVDYYVTPDGALVITLGDVMGKGIGAAIMMASVRAAMRTTSRRLSPSEAVARAAVTLDDDLQRTGTIVTLYQARIDLRTGDSRFVDAGHGLCLKVRVDGTMVLGRMLGAGGMPLGAGAAEGWTDLVGRVLPGETLVAFSDGLLDLFPDIDAAYEEIKRVVLAAPDAASVIASFEALARGAPRADDVAMIVLRKSAS